MNNISVFVLLTLSFVSTQSTAQTPEHSKLLFAAELCRHGDRTPLASFPSDTLPLSHWPEGIGQLTAIGQRAHYNLGRRLRSKYIDDMNLLSDSYQHSEIYVRSTDVDRTLMSAYSQLTGLYPPGTARSTEDVRVKFGGDVLHEDEGGLPHSIQVIPVHTERSDHDVMLLTGKNCKRHDSIMKRKYSSEEFIKFEDENKEFIITAGKIAGVSNPDNFTLFNLLGLSDIWTCSKAHGVPLQKGVTDEIVAKAKNLSNWVLEFVNTGIEARRLRAGLLINTVREYMAMAALHDMNELPSKFTDMFKKFVLFSAHDSTVAAALAALDVFNGEYPPYNSTLIWELWKKDSGDLVVTVEFNGKRLVIPGCGGEECDADVYVRATSEVTVYGERMRYIECLGLPWRYAAMFADFVTGNRGLEVKEFMDVSSVGQGGASSVGQGGASSGGHSVKWNGIGVIVVGILIGLLGVATICRDRSRYDGYTTTSLEDDKDSGERNSERDHLATQRILM